MDINGKIYTRKEYNNFSKLILEGDRNGKGKSYNLGKLEFEGEYWGKKIRMCKCVITQIFV